MENANQVLQHELNRLADEYRYIQNGNYYASYILYDHIKKALGEMMNSVTCITMVKMYILLLQENTIM